MDRDRDLAPLLAELSSELERCNKCGFCLAACPTYLAEPREWLVTRGRVSLIQDVLEGRLELHDPDFRESLESCLMCRACLAACPPQVKIDRLVSLTRAERRREAGLSLIERAIYRLSLPRPRLLAGLLTAMAPFDHPRLRRLALRAPAVGRREVLARALALGPRLPGVTGRRLIAKERQAEQRAPARGGRVPASRGRVVYFLGCSKNLLYPRAALATYRLLRRHGWEVEIPLVGCCGLPHHSAGDREGARSIARRNLALLERTRGRTVVVDESSCCAHLSSYGELFSGLVEAPRMARLAERMVDLTVFLDREGIDEPGPLQRRVVWHDPCHLRHHQGVVDAPRRLLARVPGTVLVEPDLEPGCCGGAGSIMLTKGELSDRVLEQRLAAFRQAGAELIVTGSPSCVSQYARATDGLPVLYLSEYLEAAYRRRVALS